MKRVLLTCLLSSLSLGGLNGAAWAGPTTAEHRYSPYTGIVPECADSSVLSTIQSRFSDKESQFWQSSLSITSYDRIGQRAVRPFGASYIPARFCSARVLMSDQKYRRVDYVLREDLGIIGWGYGVEFCVSGLDRNLAYAPSCNIVRPAK